MAEFIPLIAPSSHLEQSTRLLLHDAEYDGCNEGARNSLDDSGGTLESYSG